MKDRAQDARRASVKYVKLKTGVGLRGWVDREVVVSRMMRHHWKGCVFVDEEGNSISTRISSVIREYASEAD